MADLILQDELELTVVGTLLLDGRLIGETLTVLSPADFTLTGARLLFEAVGKLFLEGKPTDELSALLEAGEDCKSVTDLIMDRHLWTTAEGLAHYREELRKASRLRKLRELGGKLALAESGQAAEALVARLNGAMAGLREARCLTLGQAAVDFVTSLDVKPRYLSWGIKRLDEELFVEAGDFVVLGGYASSGKTLLALQMALGLAETYRVGFFSLETSTGKLFARIAAHRAGISLKKIKRRGLETGEHDALARVLTDLDKLPMTLIQAGGMAVTDIQALTLQHRFEVIFVDYLQLAAAPGRDRYEQVTAVSIGLHTLAQRHGVTVVALAQLARPEKSKGKPSPPTMQSFRESGQIEQDADVAMLLYPADPDDNSSNRILKVSKNKDGEKLRLELEFDGATQTLTPVGEGKAIQRKLMNEGKKARRALRQERLSGFEETEEEAPWDGSQIG